MEMTILRNLLNNEDFSRRVTPYIKEKYFESVTNAIVFGEIEKFITEYNALPTKEALLIEIEKRDNLTPDNFTDACKVVGKLDPQDEDDQWLLDTTEQWCKDRAVYNAIQNRS